MSNELRDLLPGQTFGAAGAAERAAALLETLSTLRAALERQVEQPEELSAARASCLRALSMGEQALRAMCATHTTVKYVFGE